MGAGASVVDFDRDGWQDIYLTNSGEGSKNSLYRNMGDGGFKDVAAELAIADVNQVGLAFRWARSGAITTTMATKIFSCTNGDARNSFTMIAAALTRVTEQAGFPRG